MLADLLRETDLIIWDEVPMQHKHAPECVDRTLQDIRHNNSPFGGIPVVFGGDFQQILPVVEKGSREQIVDACLQRSHLWNKMKVLTLTENMRLGQSEEDCAFAEQLLDIGHGTTTAADGSIILDPSLKCGENLDSLISSIYPGVSLGADDQYFLDRTILAARNDDVDDINTKVLEQLPGETITYHSADKAVIEEGADPIHAHYPIEYLNSINCAGIPVSKLKLKVGCPIMILRNLDPANGLCNGTHAILTKCSSQVLEVRLLGGDHAGKCAFIPRISLCLLLCQS
jgi:ATP-dependent DNA helicase PIF1